MEIASGRKKRMSPLEIFEYKQKWVPIGHEVPFHSDKFSKAIEWCKENFSKEKYYIVKYTDVYEHKMLFESRADAREFKDYLEEAYA
jgi:hypothetical protein